MVVQMLLCTLILPSAVLFSTFLPSLAESDNAPLPGFLFSWLDEKDTFVAGDIATVMVRVLGNFEKKDYKFSFNPNITVNDKMGNSRFISGLSASFGADFSNWRITFTPIMVGLFNVLITDDHFKVFDSSLHFHVKPGRMYPSACVVSWMTLANEFVAGTKAMLLILPKDAFGNNISATSEGPTSYNFTVSASNTRGSIASVLNVTFLGWNEFGQHLSIDFLTATAGNLLLHVEENNQTLSGFPLPFKVNPGALDVSNCLAQWNSETNFFQIFSKMETFVRQRDHYGNIVPGFYAFDVEVFEKGTDLSIPISDLDSKEAAPGIQVFSFSLVEPGNFTLVISDRKQNSIISGMPYDFTVFIGYCDGLNSIINGTGLNHSVAGEIARFSVILRDAYQYPSPVELERFQVKIVHESDSHHLHPSIHPMRIVNGCWSTAEWNYGAINHIEIASIPSIDPNNSSVGNGRLQASAFDVIFTPEKSGIYEIQVFCGNIPLNGGHTFRKEVYAGEVNTSLSGVVKFSPKVAKLTKNEIVVQLMDSFSNPVLLQQSKLKLEIGSINRSSFSTWIFVDDKDGLYTGCYLAKDVGTYEICASFDGMRFLPCPFGVNVYSSEYFPKANDDRVSVWEDESIAFDALENDFFAAGKATVVEFSRPNHGSLLQYGRLFRYTPYKGYFGNDSFSYTISDVNANLASGAVNICVLSVPPQFVSFPSKLQATEDVISPKFGGFLGIEITYADLLENISVILSARSGAIFLAPMVMQFWQPMWSELTVNNGDGMAKDLILEGRLEVINFALQSIQYLGSENFSGDDTIHVSTVNRNGKNDLDVPIFVEPINDPPFISIPQFIVLDMKSNEEGLLIFDRQRDEFDFSIGDPDVLHFPGNKSHFVVVFAVEVSSGFLSTNLPAELITTTELKLKSSYQWQPLQTFVTTSKHFMVKAKGIRFRGNFNHCSDIMQQLLYHGEENVAVLTVTIDDMGNYGCYSDCSENRSMPLLASASVNLIRRQPMSSLVAKSLGSAIIIESVMLFSLGVLLLYFTCKCATVLVNEKQSCDARDVELSTVQQSSDKQTSNKDVPQNLSNFTGCCSTPFLLRSHQPSNFRQRSWRRSRSGECGGDTGHSLSSSSEGHQATPLHGAPGRGS